jgi:hypothetical protein
VVDTELAGIMKMPRLSLSIKEDEERVSVGNVPVRLSYCAM